MFAYRFFFETPRRAFMLRSRFGRIVLSGIMVCLLVPVIIHSTQSNRGTFRDDPFIKLPEAVTIGPESSPYVLAQNEREKLFLRIEESLLSEPLVLEDKATIAPPGEYAGLTDVDLQKLQGAPMQVQSIREPARDKEPVSTIETVPRTSGFEGLTEPEKAKWKAWKNSRAKALRRDPGE
jgi:hypothetical protein